MLISETALHSLPTCAAIRGCDAQNEEIDGCVCPGDDLNDAAEAIPCSAGGVT